MIHQIQIQNFRSIRDVTVDLEPVMVFVGKSGSGKTNFVSAVRFLRDYLKFGQQVYNQGYNYQLCRCLTNPAGPIQFQVRFSLPGFKDQFCYLLKLEAQRLLEESLRYGDKTVFVQGSDNANRPAWKNPPALVSVPEPGPVALGRLAGIEEAVVAHTALSSSIGVYSFPYGVLSAQAGNRQQGVANGLADDGGNYLDVMAEIARNLYKSDTRKSIAAILRRVNATVTTVDLNDIHSPQKVVVGHRAPQDKILPIDLSQESDGFRRFYAHLLAIYQEPAKQTLVFEEPENGIYPGAFALLAGEFQATPGDDRGQVLLTTHSPSLLDSFKPDQIRVVELDDLETRIGPLAKDQMDSVKEQLVRAGELLTDVAPPRREE